MYLCKKMKYFHVQKQSSVDYFAILKYIKDVQYWCVETDTL